MRSPAAAIGWELRRRHRWGLAAIVIYLLVLGTIKFLVLGGRGVEFESEETFALAVVVPLAATSIYALAAFTFGLSGDLAARQSTYPARMFTLPATSAELAGWPMLYGSTGMAILWLATRLLTPWPSSFDVPSLWPALMAASLLGWMQALTWMPYPLPGLRVVVTVLWLMVFDAMVMTALHFKASEPVMLALLAPHAPLAFLVARFAVERARRGDVPDGRGTLAPLSRIGEIVPRRRDHFPSPASAQMWFEWRRHGRSLPAMVGILLPFELALLFLFHDTRALVVEILSCVLLTPPFLAAFAAAAVSKASPRGNDSYGLTPFIATRPLTSVTLIAAKLKATMWSTLAAWLLVLVATPLALRLSGTTHVVIDPVNRLLEVLGASRAIALLTLILVSLVASTWKQLVQGLCLGMSGREWAVKAYAFLVLLFLTFVFPLVRWIIGSKRLSAALWYALPWIAAALVCLKVSASVWVAWRLYDGRLLNGRTLVLGAVSWDVIVFALYGLFSWISPDPIVRNYVLVLVAILAVPLARLAAAPLSVAWNRHR